jgi:hypothetical protein
MINFYWSNYYDLEFLSLYYKVNTSITLEFNGIRPWIPKSTMYIVKSYITMWTILLQWTLLE